MTELERATESAMFWREKYIDTELQIKSLTKERDKLKAALEMVLGKVCWSVFTDEEELELEALKESA